MWSCKISGTLARFCARDSNLPWEWGRNHLRCGMAIVHRCCAHEHCAQKPCSRTPCTDAVFTDTVHRCRAHGLCAHICTMLMDTMHRCRAHVHCAHICTMLMARVSVVRTTRVWPYMVITRCHNINSSTDLNSFTFYCSIFTKYHSSVFFI